VQYSPKSTKDVRFFTYEGKFRSSSYLGTGIENIFGGLCLGIEGQIDLVIENAPQWRRFLNTVLQQKNELLSEEIKQIKFVLYKRKDYFKSFDRKTNNDETNGETDIFENNGLNLPSECIHSK
jgi:hypothetical protein